MKQRNFVVAPDQAGATLLALLRDRLPLAGAELRRLLQEDRVRVDGQPCRDAGRRLQAGQRVQVAGLPPSPRKREAAPVAVQTPRILYVDADIVVVDKPAGLTTMRHPEEAAEFGQRARKYLPATLADRLPELLARHDRTQRRGKVYAVHRLDRDTSGLVVFARNRAAERVLGQQFRAHTVTRRYLALIRGRARPGKIESYLVRDRGDGRRGSGPAGQRAVTHVRVLEELGDFTLVECRLETGRTHQVRIHLGEAGTPICGELIYDRPVHGTPLPDTSGASRLALHAAHLGLTHPRTGRRLEWHSPLPAELQRLLDRCRQRRRAATVESEPRP